MKLGSILAIAQNCSYNIIPLPHVSEVLNMCTANLTYFMLRYILEYSKDMVL